MNTDTEKKLTFGQKHILKLVKRDVEESGWTKVSPMVAVLFTDEKNPGFMPRELCEFEFVGTEGWGRARLTQQGEELIRAMRWL